MSLATRLNQLVKTEPTKPQSDLLERLFDELQLVAVAKQNTEYYFDVQFFEQLTVFYGKHRIVFEPIGKAVRIVVQRDQRIHSAQAYNWDELEEHTLWAFQILWGVSGD